MWVMLYSFCKFSRGYIDYYNVDGWFHVTIHKTIEVGSQQEKNRRGQLGAGPCFAYISDPISRQHRVNVSFNLLGSATLLHCLCFVNAVKMWKILFPKDKCVPPGLWFFSHVEPHSRRPITTAFLNLLCSAAVYQEDMRLIGKKSPGALSRAHHNHEFIKRIAVSLSNATRQRRKTWYFNNMLIIYALMEKRKFNHSTTKLFNLNFHSFEVVSRWRDSQLKGSETNSGSDKMEVNHFQILLVDNTFYL